MSDSEHTKKERLGDLLIKANLIDDVQLRVALMAQKDSGERLGTTLVELGFIDEAVLAAFLSKQVDMPCINIANIRIPRTITELIPKEVALKKWVMPIRRAADVLYMAMADPFDLETIDAVQEHLPENMTVTPMIAPEVSLKKCLQRHYQPEKMAASESVAELMGVVDELEFDAMRMLGDKVDALTRKVEKLGEVVLEIRDAVTKDDDGWD
jgi:MSHA biogenesis protein MshE